MAHIYDSYTDYLYDVSMTLWYAGSTFHPASPALVDMSAVIYHRSWKAAKHEGVTHPENEASMRAAEEQLVQREAAYGF